MPQVLTPAEEELRRERCRIAAEDFSDSGHDLRINSDPVLYPGEFNLSPEDLAACA